MSNTERRERIKYALREADMAAVICALPTQVLLLSGYWPVVGTALSVASCDGEIVILAPEDEKEIAEKGWADAVETFRPGSLDVLTNAVQAVGVPVARIAKRLGIKGGGVGYESGAMFEPASYAALHLYGADMVAILRQAFPSVSLVPADAMLARLRAVKTSHEVHAIRTACRIAERAFRQGANQLRTGLREPEAAALFRAPLSTIGLDSEDIARADGFTFCMSGAYSAAAHGAYARSRIKKQIVQQEFALVHCNSYADGYWTDITRTYCLGEADARKHAMYTAVFDARRAALDAIGPGVKGAEVDRAARAVLTAHGFGEQFKHATGHGVGFAAIDHNARPRLHPQSEDTLEAGMVFNVEPAIYVDGYGGLRHCDVVAVTKTGAELLTNFQCRPEDLVLSER
ncbi:MAG: M24 family metallopeptidase [Candidatus Binatia bacterium]